MNYLPLFFAAKDQHIIVVGDGQMAEAKCRGALKSTARVTVFSEHPTDAMREWCASGQIALFARTVSEADFTGARIVYAASDNDQCNEQVARWARAAGAWVNVLDRPEHCDFITPAIVDRDPVVVAIGTEGSAPVLARKIKAEVEAMLPSQLGRLAEAARAFRDRVSHSLASGWPRRKFWGAFFEAASTSSTLDDQSLRSSLEALLEQHVRCSAPEGHVAFVGAGPGDPELLTIKARRVIHEADVIVYDRLVSSEVLDLGRKEAKYIAVGKRGFGPSVSQSDINDCLIAEAARGLLVVRLKGGDPGIFGRLDEELSAVHGAGIQTSVVPGITTAAAAAATLEVSLTRRARNSSVTFITAHDAAGFAEHHWQQLARPGQALAVYMGRRTAAFVQGRLLMHGAEADLPVTCIENVSRRDQRALTSDLSQFVRELDDQRFDGPLMILVGIAAGATALSAHESEAHVSPDSWSVAHAAG